MSGVKVNAYDLENSYHASLTVVSETDTTPKRFHRRNASFAAHTCYQQEKKVVKIGRNLPIVLKLRVNEVTL